MRSLVRRQARAAGPASVAVIAALAVAGPLAVATAVPASATGSPAAGSPAAARPPAAVAPVTVSQGKGAGDPGMPPPVPATPGARIGGVGHFTYDEPGVEGHRIRFAVHARVAADGTARGALTYRHLLPDGKLLGRGRADVTCVNVTGDTALVTAVVPEGQGTVRNHAFYLKIIEGRPDRIETLQTNNGPVRPPSYCADPAFNPDIRRYPIERGGFRFTA
ncbi:hypothetical protein [Bailinhaonella thermotolerans]|uniref:Uncharacterized protein n=1 Tax=Bailinhaonella thermotolerans TaxID=1070861 RepID=A0A3A4AQG4_9ACTN|nr:hypothetical protein [Bailinhaonella thermotolerans]RJL30809.1 hypothetical protein D5H75_21075 [Bailinhaonella thermotolerans]